ncbi:hypothetical protein Tco_0547697 [Tanacetum coccineum]
MHDHINGIDQILKTFVEWCFDSQHLKIMDVDILYGRMSSSSVKLVLRVGRTAAIRSSPGQSGCAQSLEKAEC